MVDFAESFRWLGDKTGLREKDEYQVISRSRALQLNPGDLLTLGVDDTRGNIVRLGLVGMDESGVVKVQPPRKDTMIYRTKFAQRSREVIVPSGETYHFGGYDRKLRLIDPVHFALCCSFPVSRKQFTLSGDGRLRSWGNHETIYGFGGDQDTWPKEALLNEGEEQAPRHVAGSEKALLKVRSGEVALCTYSDLRDGRRIQSSTQRGLAQARRF